MKILFCVFRLIVALTVSILSGANPGFAAGSSSSISHCSESGCDDGNVCTDDMCQGDGSCKYIPRMGFVLGCSDLGSGTDCDRYRCDDRGECVLQNVTSGQWCEVIVVTPIGSGSCAGQTVCKTNGVCKKKVCVTDQTSIESCSNSCGEGSPGENGGDRTCCSKRECAPFSGCGNICVRPEEQSVRCCTSRSTGQHMACSWGYECNPDCGCIVAGSKCPTSSSSGR